MLYSESVEFIHGIGKSLGSRPGLRRVSMLLERMGNPQNSLKFVHVAGTNGKGSACAMLSHILTRAGYKTGLYISPFVVDFRERIQVNNEMIPEDELAASATLVRTHWEALNSIGEPPTEFEVLMAVAMDYFSRMKCDIVVLEVGLGGRLDATNVIKTPLCSVIMSIGSDHIEFLGETIPEITAEKCGIIKPHGITVSYPCLPAEASEIIEKTCRECDNRLFHAHEADILTMELSGSAIRYDGVDIHLPLPGEHQVLNASTVVETVKALRLSGLNISDADMAAGIAETRFPSRLEVLCKKPLILLDGAHNLPGTEAIVRSLKLLDGRRIHAVAGFMADKDVAGMLKEILPHCWSVTFFTPSNPRAMQADHAARIAREYCERVYLAGGINAAVIQPSARCGDDDAILFFGSLYAASDVRPVVIRLFEGPTRTLRRTSP